MSIKLSGKSIKKIYFNQKEIKNLYFGTKQIYVSTLSYFFDLEFRNITVTETIPEKIKDNETLIFHCFASSGYLMPTTISSIQNCNFTWEKLSATTAILTISNPTGNIEGAINSIKDQDYLCFEPVTNGSVSIIKTGSLVTSQKLMYSENKVDWTDMNWGSGNGFNMIVGHKYYIKGTFNYYFSESSTKYIYFETTGTFNTSGDISSLKNFNTSLGNYQFFSLFKNNTGMLTCPKMSTLYVPYQWCCAYMFSGCTSLTTLPELNGKSLGSGCYAYMFNGCSNIKLSTSKTSTYNKSYRIPTSGTASKVAGAQYEPTYNMFSNTGGTLTADPTLNTTYYTSNEVIG